jgi:hypothetical protein
MKQTVLFLATLLLAGSAVAQNENKPPDGTKFYKLDFVIRELQDGKIVNTRSFVLSLSQNQPFNSGSVRTGDKVPVPTGGVGGQFTFIDVGVNIDCRLMSVTDNQLLLTVTADVSSVVNQGTPPVITQNKWNSGVTVPLRKPTILFSADGASAKRQMQLELTATPIP